MCFKRHILRTVCPSVDVHCHILPGVDDGFSDRVSSLHTLQEMKKHGIEKVIFTPHVDFSVYPDNTVPYLKEKYQAFVGSLPADLGLTYRLGAEYMVTPNVLDYIKQDTLLLSEGENRRVLIEMSYFYPSPNIREVIYELVLSGYIPVVAHPERYSYYANKLQEFEYLHDMGAEFQLNMMSLSGCYGRSSIRILKYLLHNNMYSFLATDLHSETQYECIRKIRLDSKTFDKIKRITNKNID